MNDLAAVILSALMSAKSPLAKEWRDDPTAPKLAAEYHHLLEEDDSALSDVNRWMKENEAFRAAGGGLKPEELSSKIAIRLTGIVDLYEAFLKKHPDHVEARIAYGSFLNEVNEDEKAAEQWEKARLLDPLNPAVWNDLANYFGHVGPVTNAFAYYAKAIELDPDEPIYYSNFATTVYLFRRDAESFYGINEQQVFDKALALYHKALDLTPGSFEVASDLAQTYYGIKPFRMDDAMKAWQDAFKLAKSDVERQSVYIHFARLEIKAQHYDSASNHLAMVVAPELQNLRTRLSKLMIEQQTGTNAPPGPDTKK